MESRSWEFLDSLSKSEIELLSSAIELSGLPDYYIAEGLSSFINDLVSITGCKDYTSILHWFIGDNRDKSLDNLESEYLSQIYKPIVYTEGKNQNDIIQKAFCILDLRGLYWSQELLDDIYLFPSKPAEGDFVYGRDIRYGLQHGDSKTIESKGQPIPKILLLLVKLGFFRKIAKNYLQNKLLPLICALIIIRNEHCYQFTDSNSCKNFICALIDSKSNVDSVSIIKKILSDDARSQIVSKTKWNKIKSFENDIIKMLNERILDNGIIEDIKWNYIVQDVDVNNSVLSKRRHAFMHAIGDDIKAVIAKLVRDLNSNVQLSELKGDEILAIDAYYKKWLEDIRSIPLDDSLPETVLFANIKEVVAKGKDLVNKVSPLFHTLVDHYAYIFHGYQDGNNRAYERLEGFIKSESKLRKMITDFSSSKTYRKVQDTPAIYMMELIKSSLDDVTKFVEFQNEAKCDMVSIKLNPSDFQELVLNNFKSNLLEKAFFKRDNVRNRIKVYVSCKGDKLAVCLSNNGEPFKGDTSRIFEEHYTCGEIRGSGQGMYDARQYMNYIGGDIQMQAFQYMEYPVRFVLIFPISNKQV
ncbi:MAG: hypothetical protein MR299_07040 [Bacteroidales bacterium]|nr:hypothetical protein [Bacteroidales bacterium]